MYYYCNSFFIFYFQFFIFYFLFIQSCMFSVVLFYFFYQPHANFEEGGKKDLNYIRPWSNQQEISQQQAA